MVTDWLGKNKVSPGDLCNYVNTTIRPTILNWDKEITSRTAYRWLHVLGYVRSRTKKGMYVDGHEREDVVKYRKGFLMAMDYLEPRFIKAESGAGTNIVIPDVPTPIVFYTHDECTFYSNDGETHSWHKEGRAPLPKKSRGQSLMVSAFISELDGVLAFEHDPLDEADPGLEGTVTSNKNRSTAKRKVGEVAEQEPRSALRIIHAGKGRDGYWCGKDVAEQFREAIRIHKARHPDYVGLWAFDNSSNHGLYAHDALQVSKMNLNPGGEQAKLRDGFFNGQPQRMVDENGEAKGMKKVLEERGLWNDALRKTCVKGNGCKSDCNPLRNDCCADRVLRLQPDFLAQKGLLAEIAAEEQQLLIFYPKFHPEFNFIEMFWGACKAYTRRNCNYSFPALQRTVPQSFKSVSLETIRRFARKTFRFMDAYRKGLVGKDADRAVKQFRSHRRILEGAIWDEMRPNPETALVNTV